MVKGRKASLKTCINFYILFWAERLRDVIRGHACGALYCSCMREPMRGSLLDRFFTSVDKIMKTCVAANCSNKKSPTVSLFNFLKDPELSRKWIINIQRTRAEWKGPTQNSVLCSEHFDSSCFEAN